MLNLGKQVFASDQLQVKSKIEKSNVLAALHQLTFSSRV